MGGFAAGPPPTIDVPLSTFSGYDSELTPIDCPEGLSPDNQDCIFLPGEVDSREGVVKVLTVPASGAILYAKTYVQPNDVPLNLYLDAQGKLWVESVSTTPGVKAQIYQITPGLYGQSVSAFGREYIALSDLLHGQYPPLQYDGVNVDRVSQDGPGVGPVPSDYQQSITVAGILISLTFDFGGAAIFSITEAGFVATVTTTTPHNLKPQQNIIVVQSNVAGYNGLQQVSTIPTATTFTMIMSASGLGAAGNFGFSLPAIGTVDIPVANTPNPLPLINDVIIINGTGNGFDNGTTGAPINWTVLGTSTTAAPGFYKIYFSIASGSATANYTGALTPTKFTIGGQSSVGPHGIVVGFLTRNGFLTEPSPPVTFYSLGGTKWLIDKLPIGPANVVARYIGATGAGGGNYFVIPADVTIPDLSNPLGVPIVVKSTIVPDNTSTSAIIDVPDNTLFDSIAIDEIGNDLFDQRVLGPVAGFFAYGSRLFAWADYNKVENFLNLGFEGGYLSTAPLAPTGWTINCVLGTGAANGELVSTALGGGWTIWGGGANPQGQIQQTAYLDPFGTQIILPNTAYSIRIMAAASTILGQIIVDLSSASTGFITQAALNCSAIGASQAYYTVNLGTTPAVIPSDLVLRVYGQNIPAAAAAVIEEFGVVYSKNPYNDNQDHVSYILNPEAFAQTTGNVGPQDDPSPIRCHSLQRNNVLLKTAAGTHTFEQNDSEPYLWNVNQLSRSVGACSIRAGDPGQFGTGDAAEDWDVSFNENGLYLFAGGDFWKISQEVAEGRQGIPTINDINWAAEQTIVVKNDVNMRRIYILAPINGATTPNIVFMVDYRELDTAAQISGASPIHISLTGKMWCSDLTRKWSRWSLAFNCAEVMVRPNNVKEVVFGGNFGNAYTLDSAKLTDDDYGQIFPYYTTYFFVNHEQEQALGLGSGRKVFKKINASVTGVGLVSWVPLVNSLNNPYPETTLRELVQDTDISNPITNDYEWLIGAHIERCAFQLQIQPYPGTTDVKFRLAKLIIAMQKDPQILGRQGEI